MVTFTYEETIDWVIVSSNPASRCSISVVLLMNLPATWCVCRCAINVINWMIQDVCIFNGLFYHPFGSTFTSLKVYWVIKCRISWEDIWYRKLIVIYHLYHLPVQCQSHCNAPGLFNDILYISLMFIVKFPLFTNTKKQLH